MSKHTQAPWDIRNRPNDMRITPEGKPYETICTMGNWLDGEQEELNANARLIAAAPEMLEALERGVAAFEAIDKATSWNDNMPDWWASWFDETNRARRIISKAMAAQ